MRPLNVAPNVVAAAAQLGAKPFGPREIGMRAQQLVECFVDVAPRAGTAKIMPSLDRHARIDRSRPSFVLGVQSTVSVADTSAQDAAQFAAANNS